MHSLRYWVYPTFFPEWVYQENIEIVTEGGKEIEKTFRSLQVEFFVPSRLMHNTFQIAAPAAFIIGWRVLMDWLLKEKQANELEKKSQETELKYLKSQINPHFLFNSLNNIYGLALENSKHVPNLILKLSDFLSFSLYESDKKLIPLQKEMKLMQDFIELQEARFGDRVEVHFNFKDHALDSEPALPPLLLIPFVENAFKHSLKEETGTAQISIDLQLERGQLIFKVNNSKPEANSKSLRPNGLGLENSKKRLDLLFPNQYELSIQDLANQYQITLQLNLNQ